MSYINWDDDWYEPSEFDIMMTEFKETIKSNAKQEIKDEIKYLQTELAKLKEVRDNWKKIERENSQLKLEVQKAKENAERDAKNARLEQLLSECIVNVWQACWKSEYIKPKCDKCDEHRQITFFSPSGRKYTEDCDCAKKKLIYHPEETTLQRIHIPFNGDRDSKGSPIYLSKQDNNNDYYVETISFRGDGKSFEELDKTWRPYFTTLELAQEFCDWKNNQKV